MASAMAQLNEALRLSKPPEIQLEPAWWPWLPLIPFNIAVETQSLMTGLDLDADQR
jgi:hypothetical protein